MLFGSHVLLPIMGYNPFSWLARFSINLHNYIGPFFIVCALAMFVTFLRDNLWRKHDMEWIKKGGGLLTGEHVPSGRFNAGEKSWFWVGVFFLSLLVGATGLILDFANFGQGRTLMQQAHVVHVTAALIYIAAFFGHLYMGTIGTEGAYAAMRYGYVDETWAREHHEIWYQDIKSGKAPSGEVKPADRAPPLQPAEK
jgi:formate dehydrogenase subunit gamma